MLSALCCINALSFFPKCYSAVGAETEHANARSKVHKNIIRMGNNSQVSNELRTIARELESGARDVCGTLGCVRYWGRRSFSVLPRAKHFSTFEASLGTHFTFRIILRYRLETSVEP